MPRWAMVIDLRKCIGCETCRHVCKEMNQTPGGGEWRRVIDPMDRAEERIFIPISCMHCGKPACLDVCPTGATQKGSSGIVDVDFAKCLGCGACIVACPYGVRYLSDQDIIYSSNQSNPLEATSGETDRIGISSKCNFCRSCVESAGDNGLKPGIDPEATPCCVRYCLGGALHFGDLEDQNSNVSTLIRENRAVRLHEEIGTLPSVYYIVGYS